MLRQWHVVVDDKTVRFADLPARWRQFARHSSSRHVSELHCQTDRPARSNRARPGIATVAWLAVWTTHDIVHAESMNALEPRIQSVQTVLDCRYPMCASRLEHVFVGAGSRPALGMPGPSALRRIGGPWHIGWSSGFALNLAIVPNFSRANLSYAPDIRLRGHVIKLTATIHFF